MVKLIENETVDNEMLFAIFTNCSVGACIILVFTALQGQIVYDVRRQLRTSRDMNTLPKMTEVGKLFYWRRWPLSMEDDLQRVIGLDGVVAVRFSWLCFKFCAVYSVVAVFLCGYYYYRTSPASAEASSSLMQSIQISHSCNKHTAELATVACWIMSILIIVLLELEYQQFCLLRKSYFRGNFPLRCDAEKHWKAHFQRTILVKYKKPPEKDQFSERKYRRKMERTFTETEAQGAPVENVSLCRDTETLRAAVDQYDSLVEDKKALDLAKGHGFCLALGDVIFHFGPRRLVNRIPLLVRLGIIKKPTMARISEAKAAVRREYAKLHEHVEAGEGPSLGLPAPGQDSDSEAPAQSEDNPTIGNAVAFSWKQIRKAFDSPCKKKRCENYAFVTFGTRYTQALAVQLVLQNLVATRAPYPSDIIWQNITYSDTRTYLRHFWTLVAMILGMLVLVVICVTIQAYLNLRIISSELENVFPEITAVFDPVLSKLGEREAAVNGQLASLALVGVLFVVPPIVRSFLSWYDAEKFKSKIMLTSVYVCFVYNLVALYASTFAGGALSDETGMNSTTTTSAPHGDENDPLHAAEVLLRISQMFSPLEVMQTIVRRVATNLDKVSPYFMEFIMTKLGARLAIYLLRPYALVPWCAHKALGWAVARARSRRRGGDSSRAPMRGARQPDQSLLRESPCSSSGPEEDEDSEADEEAEWPLQASEEPARDAQERGILEERPYYDWLLVDLVVVLTLCFMYGVLAPLIILPSMIFFWVYGSMIHYNFLFIYTQEFDTGGEFFFTLVDNTFISLLMSQVLLQTYIVSELKGTGIHTIMQPLLILVVAYTWRAMHRLHESECRALPLEQCKRADKRCPTAPPRREAVPAYRDPLLLRAQNIIDGGDLKHEWELCSFHHHDPHGVEEAEADSDDDNSSDSDE